jgi:predicted O-methyltransferase YrrM
VKPEIALSGLQQDAVEPVHLRQRTGLRRCSPDVTATVRRRCGASEPGNGNVPTNKQPEAAITTPLKPASWIFAEEYVAEDEILAHGRGRAEEVGVVPIGPGGGAALRFLASALDARAVVEIGTGTGVSGLWLLRGMRADGVLTSVDTEAEHQRLARETFTEAGIPAQRARLIPGAALDVLPRLTDGHYDLVFCDGDKEEYPDYLAEALRLLRPGGVVAFDNALWHDRVADPAQRDATTVAIRELAKSISENENLVAVLLPVGDGLLVAKKVWTPEV